MIRHSWGLPSLSSATAFAVVVYLLLKTINDNEEVVRNDELFVYVKHLKLILVCLLGLLIMGGIKIVSGEDSPPSVVAGWMVGCVTLGGCYWFGNDVDAWLMGPRTTVTARMAVVGATNVVGSAEAPFTFISTLAAIFHSYWFQEFLFISFLLPMLGILCLMCYPVPFKYNSGGTYPQTAGALGYAIGSIIGMRWVDLLSMVAPAVPSRACVSFMNRNETADVMVTGMGKADARASDGGVGGVGGVGIGNGGYHTSTSPCAWSWIVRTGLGVFLSCSTFLLLSSLYVHYNSTMRKYSFNLFRPRLSSHSKAILKAAEQSEQCRLFPSVVAAQTIVCNLTMNEEDVPVADSVKMRDQELLSMNSTISAASSSTKKRARRRDKSSSSTDHSGGMTAGVNYGTFESTVPFNYVSTMLMGMMTTLVGPCIVSSFGG